MTVSRLCLQGVHTETAALWGPWSTPLPPAMSLEVLYYWSRQYYVFVPLAISPMPFVCQFVGIKAGLPEESVSLPMAVIG